MDYSLIKAIYEMYYGDSEIIDFFKEQGQNVLNPSVGVTTFRLVIWRFIYTLPGIILAIFLGVYYRSKSFSEKFLEKKIFTDNPSLSKILMIGRYLLGFGLAFLVLTRGRTFYYSCFHNCIIGNSIDFVRVFFAAVLFVAPILDYKKMWNDIRTFPVRRPKSTCFFFIVAISIISTCLVEYQIGSKMYVFIYLIHVNISYWFLLQLFFVAIFRTPIPGAIISLVFSYVIGLANDIVYQFRGNYIMFGDLTVMRTAFEVAGNYDYRPTKWFYISAVLLVISIAFVIFVSIMRKRMNKKADVTEEKTENKFAAFLKNRIVSTVIFVGLIVLYVAVTFKTGDFYGKVFGVGWNYNDNVSVVGYIPYFLSNMDSTRKVTVDGYSSEEVGEIFQNIDDQQTEQGERSYPNIILIQNEAFSDYRIACDIETDVDPMPFIHSLTENTQKGYLNMSVTGGPTSNTEFEVLSRSSLQFFPYGSVPYTQYLKQNIPSLVVALENQSVPYHTVAYHSYYSSGYNRNSVYDYLGFDEKHFENNFLNEYSAAELPRGYMTDEADYRNVIKMYEDSNSAYPDEPFFCFNVTIQGHGGYTGGPFYYENPVRITNFEATDSMNTYMSSVRLSDEAFKGLVEYFSNVDEPTIIMMYGDHQPSFDDEAKEKIEEHPAWKNTTAQALSQYYVPYIVWANYDIDESDGLLGWNEKISDTDLDGYADNEGLEMNKLSTNYVGSYLLNIAGLELSAYDKLLLDIHEDYPAVTAIGIWDKDGYYYDGPMAVQNPEVFSDLEMVQYNLIFDKHNKLTEEFLP